MNDELKRLWEQAESETAPTGDSRGTALYPIAARFAVLVAEMMAFEAGSCTYGDTAARVIRDKAARWG